MSLPTNIVAATDLSPASATPATAPRAWRTSTPRH